MNLIALVILTALLVDFLVGIVADWLNLKVLRDELPEPFQGIYDPGRYRNSQAYLKETTRFGWLVATVDLVILLGFWFGRGFPALDHWIRGWGLGPVSTGLLFMGVLIGIKALLSLPFSVYATFVIEERYGFNTTTWRTFITDRIKGAILGIFLGVPLLAGILAFFEYAGHNAWWYCWVSVTLFTLILQFVAPRWIMPLFNKFSPLENGELKTAILNYARSINFPLDNVFVMDGSKRSSKANAFFTGFGRHKRIVLFDTLVQNHTVSELVAVLAHEMGHYKKKHILKSMLLGVIQTGVMFFLLSLFISNPTLFRAFYMDQVSVYAGLIFFSMLYAPLEFFLGIFLQMNSRKNEYQADGFAVQTTGDGKSLANALKKLSISNLSNLSPHPLYVFLHYSHPPILERLKAIRALAAQEG